GRGRCPVPPQAVGRAGRHRQRRRLPGLRRRRLDDRTDARRRRRPHPHRRPVMSPASLSGQGAVVTGAGHGIGAALARRLALEGVRVVVNDLDADAATRVAEEIGGFAAPGDCASEEGVRTLLAEATRALGRVDLFFANAGLDHVAGEPTDWLATSDAAWDTMHQVNVMAHVRAARALVPTWLESGGGRFVVTASAAGLLTMLGAAPYSVTKHGAVAFAEWLSATYGHRGVVVQAICPQGVATRVYEESGPLKALLLRDDVRTPDAVE